jgi:lipopolysaccharide/colanic/teichoic acid biosynthesis glycosyltransferase
MSSSPYAHLQPESRPRSGTSDGARGEERPHLVLHAGGAVRTRERGLYRRVGKRGFDITLAAVALVLAAPAFGLISLTIRLTLGPGVLFRQTRVGHGSHPFEMLKFRTMHHDRRQRELPFVGPDRRRTHKSGDDPRHTPLGRILRRTSLDELPQLINVIRGDMSLVGPRPEIWEVAEANGIVDHVRHTVRPGITGPWQISPLRDGALLSEGLELDAEYARSVTARRDLAILLGTIPVLLSPNGH